MVQLLHDTVGMLFETEVTEEMINDLASSNNVRIFSNEMVITMDYYSDRVNVIYDEKTKRILEVYNG